MSDFVVFNIDIQDSTAKKNNYSTTLLLGEFDYDDNATLPLKAGVYFTDDRLTGGNPVRTMIFANLTEVGLVFRTTSKIYKASATYFSQRVTPENLIVGQVRSSDTDRASALDAIVLENNNFYIVCDVDADETEAAEIMVWTEAQKKTFIYLTNASDVVGSGSTDIASESKALGYNRTQIIYSKEVDTGSDLVRHDVAVASFWGALSPGTETQKFLSLVGCTAVDDDTLGVNKLNTTNITNLEAKNCNAYVTSNVGNIFEQGNAVSGRFMDATRYADYIKDELTAEVSLLFKDPGSKRKIAYTDAGIGRIKNAIFKVLDRELKLGKITPYSTYDNAGRLMTVPYEIVATAVADVSTANKNARLYNGITVVFRYSSAIHKLVTETTMVV